MSAPKSKAKTRALVPTSTSNPKGFEKQVKQFLHNLSQDPTITVEDMKAISTAIRLAPETARIAIVKAQEVFFSHAEEYVDLHLNCTRAAYNAGEFGLAANLAQWALLHLGNRTTRLIEEAEEGDGKGLPRVMIGVKVGGMGDVVDGSVSNAD